MILCRLHLQFGAFLPPSQERGVRKLFRSSALMSTVTFATMASAADQGPFNGRDPLAKSSVWRIPGEPMKIRVERHAGIEPAYAAWEAAVLPLN